MPTPEQQRYLDDVVNTSARRLRWWNEARFGMFIHWGLYAQMSRGEWAMNMERIPVEEYEKLAPTWKPGPRPMRAWAKLARDAGMKYMVLTTKHHEGFLLWDSKMSDFNAARVGPCRDLIAEYVDACREFGLKVGFYYSLMDWHHPDGHRCARDEAARLRFVEYTQGCVRELLSNYGKIDILWYDVSFPLGSPEAWDSYTLNAMARKLQPHILINDRAQLPEDFGTPEGHVTAAPRGRAWEACMTFNGAWGWQQTPDEDWLSARHVVNMLRTCTAGEGNLLLNVGPLADGSLPKLAVDRLTQVGKWLKTYGGAVYGRVERVNSIISTSGSWTLKNGKHYLWVTQWPGKQLALGAIHGRLQSARLFPSGKKLAFTQTHGRIVIHGLPEKCPDKTVSIGMLELKFAGPVQQFFSAGCEMPEETKSLEGRWVSPTVNNWRVSKIMPKNGDVTSAQPQSLNSDLGWKTISAESATGFVNVHELFPSGDGIVYLASYFEVYDSQNWRVHLGHDGGARVFVDGSEVLTAKERINPARPGRSNADVTLTKGTHEVVIAFDLSAGNGWGVFFQWELAESSRKGQKRVRFPAAL